MTPGYKCWQKGGQTCRHLKQSPLTQSQEQNRMNVYVLAGIQFPLSTCLARDPLPRGWWSGLGLSTVINIIKTVPHRHDLWDSTQMILDWVKLIIKISRYNLRKIPLLLRSTAKLSTQRTLGDTKDVGRWNLLALWDSGLRSGLAQLQKGLVGAVSLYSAFCTWVCIKGHSQTPAPWSWPFHFQNCERIYFCCLC